MASIRRGVSSSAAANDHQSQSLYFLFTSSSSSTTPTSPITTASPSRKWASSSSYHHFSSFFNWWWDSCKWWKKNKKKRFVLLLLRIFFFFLLGFFLGFSPFAHLFYLHDDDVAHFKPHHFFFNSIPTATTPPIFLHCNNSQQQRQQQQQSSSLVSVDHLQESDFDLRHDNDDLNLVHLHRPIIPQKLLIIVTPTYNRALQAYYLTRLAHTLSLVPPPLLWIVVEMDSASSETANILRRMGVLYRHLVCDKSSNNVKDRGVHQRNTALDHIERHRLDGIVFFADDDNIYSLHLFHHLRSIRKFGTWPVAMLAQNKNKATLEGPVCNGSQVVGWHTNEKSKRLRRFHVDMSGFAFNTTILWDVKRRWRPTSLAIRQLDTVKEGFQETTFIEQVVEDESQMESVPRDCSRIMNWHLHLEARHLVYPKAWQVSRNLDVVNSLREDRQF